MLNFPRGSETRAEGAAPGGGRRRFGKYAPPPKARPAAGGGRGPRAGLVTAAAGPRAGKAPHAAERKKVPAAGPAAPLSMQGRGRGGRGGRLGGRGGRFAPKLQAAAVKASPAQADLGGKQLLPKLPPVATGVAPVAAAKDAIGATAPKPVLSSQGALGSPAVSAVGAAAPAAGSAAPSPFAPLHVTPPLPQQQLAPVQGTQSP